LADSGLATQIKTLGHSRMFSGAVNWMKMKIANVGALSTSVEADSDVFRHYKSGILDSAMCKTGLNHSVNIVGWGEDSSTSSEYWIIRNSWGTTWGESGFMRLKIEEGDGICGAQMQPSFPNIS
jgi:C1A family cysteine protease